MLETNRTRNTTSQINISFCTICIFFFSFIHNQWKHKETPKQEELSLTNEKCTFFSQHYMWFWRGGKKGFISKWQPDIKITKDSQTLCNTWSAPAYNINLCACPSSGISFPTQESKQSYSLTKSLQHNALDKYKKKKRESLPPYKTNKTPRDNRMFQCNLCISPYDKENKRQTCTKNLLLFPILNKLMIKTITKHLCKFRPVFQHWRKFSWFCKWL